MHACSLVLALVRVGNVRPQPDVVPAEGLMVLTTSVANG